MMRYYVFNQEEGTLQPIEEAIEDFDGLYDAIEAFLNKHACSLAQLDRP